LEDDKLTERILIPKNGNSGFGKEWAFCQGKKTGIFLLNQCKKIRKDQKQV
jgi:hypothetical protein